jgi:predicted ATPase
MPSSALDYITIRGFKSIASIEKLPPRPINIVIGANGSGKSNFLGVFAFLHEIRKGRLREYVTATGGAEKVLHFGSKTTRELEIQLSFHEGDRYELILSPTRDDGLFPSEEVIYPWNRDRDPLDPLGKGLSAREQGREAGISDPKCFGDTVCNHLDQWRVYHLSDTSPMLKTNKVDDNNFLRPEWTNLAAFLYYLGRKHEDAYSFIVRTVQRVAPFFADVQLKPRRVNPDDIRLEWRHKKSDQYFDASSLSDGTLRFIALATLFLQPEEFRPSVILVDEPELGLHPYALEMLAALIRQASVTTQVIV